MIAISATTNPAHGPAAPISNMAWRVRAGDFILMNAPNVPTKKIEGNGATFESLAKRFLPGVPLADVVALACRTANVGTLPGGRIALYGDTMVNLSKNLAKRRKAVFSKASWGFAG